MDMVSPCVSSRSVKVFQVNPGSLFPAFRRLERGRLAQERMAAHCEQSAR